MWMFENVDFRSVDFLQKKNIPHVHIYMHVRIDCFLVGGGLLKTPLSTAHSRAANYGPTPAPTDAATRVLD